MSEGACQFLRFSIIGVVGFVVDAATLTLVTKGLGLGLYVGRVISFLVAATATWALNRRFTFITVDTRPLVVQWLRFVSANAIGGAANYATYAVLVSLVPFVTAQPVWGVAAGSFAGLIFNFTINKFWVFRHRNEAGPQGPEPSNPVA